MNTENNQLQNSEDKILVDGALVTELPQELYIPPQALKVYLESFEGPLDLLLYLIRKENLDISKISIAKVTEQYTSYIAAMDALKLELASKYLVMAALLAEIKSRLLLPKPPKEDDDEEDPSLALIRQLQEYERIKLAAERIDELPRVDRDIIPANAWLPEIDLQPQLPEVMLNDLLIAFSSSIKRASYFEEHGVKREILTVREKMTHILDRIQSDDFTLFEHFFVPEEGRQGVITSLLAILELIKLSMIVIIQNEPYEPLYIKANEGIAENIKPEPVDTYE